MVDKFFVQYRQWLTIFLCNGVMLLLLLLNIVNIVVLKTTGFIFLVLTTIQTMVDNFLCNGVMMLLLLLNIVNIVVLKTTGFIFLVLTTIQTMVDNFLCNGVMMLLLLLTIVVKITRQIILLPSLRGRGRGWGFVGLFLASYPNLLYSVFLSIPNILAAFDLLPPHCCRALRMRWRSASASWRAVMGS